MKKTVVVLAALCLCGVAPAFAGDDPADPFAALESGKKSFETACSKCHKLDLPLAKRLDRAGWEDLLGVMTGRGASFAPAERALIVDYLVVKSAFENKCSTCHGTQNALAAKRTREEWKKTVERMAAKTPPEFTAQEIALITAYLTLVVGSE
ncbi:MAG TPA: c-type cytochrome [Candidatus Methanoperedens sp.]|nr:c-type cytochrome [Candidatus Methanoperedens sp.]